MHHTNDLFWKACKKKYPSYFSSSRVIEFGSFNINGSVRVNFDTPSEYIGVDWRAGPGFDVVSFAHELIRDDKFDVVISASMLEHDPHWHKSIQKMIEVLSDDGMLLLSWGAARDAEHEHDTACVGKFHALPAGKVLTLLVDEGVYVHEFLYESQFGRSELPSGGDGEVCLIAFKNPAKAVGRQAIAPLFPEDNVDD